MGCVNIYLLQYVYLLTIVLGTDGDVNRSDLFEYDNYISKCCPEQYYMSDNNICVRYNLTMKIPDFSDVDIYDYGLTKINKTVKDVFLIIYGNIHNQIVEKDIFNTYLIEDGSLNIEVALPNTYQRVTKVRNGLFCVDYFIAENETVPELKFWYTLEEKPTVDVAFLIATPVVFFISLTLTLVVFILMKECLSLFDRILLSMISSLMVACGMLTLQLIVTSSRYDYTSAFCVSFTFFIYLFILSSFCWMNVIGFHIWYTLRRESLISNGARTLLYYCCFAWGIPLVMGVVLVAINQIDLTQVPWFIKPNIPVFGCFLSGYEKFFYLYVPILILLLCNWVVLLITAYKLGQIQAMKEILHVGKRRQWFIKYLQLTIVMTLAWILETISFKMDDLTVWYIVQTFYMILGLAIFLILCCNSRSMRSLRSRLSRDRKTEFCLAGSKELHPLAGER